MITVHFCEFDPLWWYTGKPFCGAEEWSAISPVEHEVTCPDCLKMIATLNKALAEQEAE